MHCHDRPFFPRFTLARLLALLILASSLRADAGWRDLSSAAADRGELTAAGEHGRARATDSLRAGTTSTELACEALRSARPRHSVDTTHAPPPAHVDTASYRAAVRVQLAAGIAGSGSTTRRSPASPRAPPFAC